MKKIRVIIAFSAGLESTYLVYKALKEGRDVALAIMNVAQSPYRFMLEVYAAQQIAKWFDDRKEEFTGSIVQIFYQPKTVWRLPKPSDQQIGYTRGSTQQFNVMLGLMQLRRLMAGIHPPSAWVGWIKEDSSDHSLNEADFTDKEYHDLLGINEYVGVIAGTDIRKTRFRAPLWDIPKKDVHERLPKSLFELTVPNGKVTIVNQEVTLTVSPVKRQEYHGIGVKLHAKYVYDLNQFSLITRAYCGVFEGVDKDLGIEGLTPELLKVVCGEYLSKDLWVVVPPVTLKEESIFIDNLAKKIFALKEAFYQLQPASSAN